MYSNDYTISAYYHIVKYHGTKPHAYVPSHGWPFKICARAFENCSTLETVRLPENCSTIEASAFENCENLREVSLPATLCSIGPRAFANCPKLEKLWFPNGICTKPPDSTRHEIIIHEDSFLNCNHLRDPNGFVVIGTTAQNYWGQDEQVTVTEGITRMNLSLFANNAQVVRISLPESLTEIPNSAFLNCSNLEKIRIPKSITAIRSHAFDGCEKLYPEGSDFLILDGWLCGYRGNGSHVVIPDSVTAIADAVFRYHSEIRSLTIPDTVTHIGMLAFCGCTSLSRVVIPSGLKEIQNHTFSGCTALKEVFLPQGLKSIGTGAFAKCSQLESLELPESLESICRDSLSGTPVKPRADGLLIVGGAVKGYAGSDQEVIIPEGVTEICDYAFHKSKITAVSFPKTLRHIGKQAFELSESLTTLTFREGLQSIDNYAFWGCPIRNLRFPSTLRSIGDFAFTSQDLQEVLLPMAMEKLGMEAFIQCPIRSLSIPEALFFDHGKRPGEHHIWVDHYVDNNPFPYRDGTILRTRVLCPESELFQEKLVQWAKFLNLKDPIIQIWYRSWDEDEPCLSADDYLPEDVNYNGPNLVSLPVAQLHEIPNDLGDYLVVILHRQEIEKRIRADDSTVTDYLDQIGPDILQDLITLAEEAGSVQVLKGLNDLRNQFYNEQKG